MPTPVTPVEAQHTSAIYGEGWQITLVEPYRTKHCHKPIEEEVVFLRPHVHFVIAALRKNELSGKPAFPSLIHAASFCASCRSTSFSSMTSASFRAPGGAAVSFCKESLTSSIAPHSSHSRASSCAPHKGTSFSFMAFSSSTVPQSSSISFFNKIFTSSIALHSLHSHLL